MKEKPLVLIIDDSSINLTLLCNLLEQQNFRVLSAESGKKGLEIAKQSKPDIILLDVAMPGWDGYNTCQRIKADVSLNKIPVLFLSALDEIENKVRGFQVGAVDFIGKPFQKDELLARVQTHIELAHLRQNLEHEVANKTKKIQSLLEALQVSYEKTQQVSILKTEFLRNISHEFFTPLNAIKGMTEMLIEDTELSEEQYHCAKTVIKATQQLNTLITNALNFADQFQGEYEQVFNDFQIHEIVDHVLNKFFVNTQDLQITTEIAPQLCTPLRGNHDKIDKILSNLVDNAIKFTRRGQIMIRVQPLERDDKKQWVRFEVSDTGIGIAQEKQVDLFGIFYQIDGSSTRLYDGVGMGLAVAKMFTEKMGGQIGVNSILGKGSTFWFNIPLEINS